MIQTITVGQLTRYLRSMLEGDSKLSGIFVRGEISGLRDNYASGHLYFSLKDDTGIIRCVMFAGHARRLKFKPENGLAVICSGDVTLYERDGQLQISVYDMLPQGAGALALAFEQTKRRLAAEGLFDAERKKEIPAFPEKIGIVTSASGAAIRDITTILSRRYPSAQQVLCPAAVQGAAAPGELACALAKIDEMGCDVIIFGRGGGSPEDLWAFNTEEVAYALARCKTPVISAVGHETDTTISDFVADLRAPTPSAAAELAVPETSELIMQLGRRQKMMTLQMRARVEQMVTRLNFLSSRSGIVSLSRTVNEDIDRLERNRLRIRKAADAIISQKFYQLQSRDSALQALNPLATLNRGYAIVEKEGKIVQRLDSLAAGDSISVRFSDGKACAVITDIEGKGSASHEEKGTD